MSEANSHQVGGKHYQSIKIPQHWDIVSALGWDYFIGNATKYLWRLGRKHPGRAGQLQDLDKAIHFLQKKRELLIAEIEDDNRAMEPQSRGYVDQDR